MTGRIGKLAAGLFAVATLGCSGGAKEPSVVTPTPVVEKPAAKVKDYDTIVAEARSVARKAAVVAERNGRSASVYTRAAHEWMRVARLTGSYEDFARAETLLDAAFSFEDSVPPHLMRAHFNYTLHRLDAAEADLENAEALPLGGAAMKNACALMRANLELQRGRFDEAGVAYEAHERQEATPAVLASLAFHRWRTGRFDDAEALYRRALAMYGRDDAEPRAWTHLQLGLMDLERSRFEDALAHYREADAILPGYWLVEEHIAEVLAELGRTDEAEAMYRDIIARTDNPEFMDALAGLLQDAGRDGEAHALIAQAAERYQARMERFPEATYGHALEHFVEHGEPARAVEIAEANFALRPNAEAQVGLARAYLVAGRTEDATAVVDRSLASSVRMVELHEVAADVMLAAGDASGAAEQRQFADLLRG